MDKALKRICHKKRVNVVHRIVKYLPYDLCEKIILLLSPQQFYLFTEYGNFDNMLPISAFVDKYINAINILYLDVNLEFANIMFNHIKNIKISINYFLFRLYNSKLQTTVNLEYLNLLSYHIYKYVKKTGLAEKDDFNVFTETYINNTIQPFMYAIAIYAVLLSNQNHLLIYKMLRYANNLTFAILQFLLSNSIKYPVVKLISYNFDEYIIERKYVASHMFYKFILDKINPNIQNYNFKFVSNINNFDKNKFNIYLITSTYDLFLIRFYNYRCFICLNEYNKFVKLFSEFKDNYIYCRAIWKNKYNFQSLLDFYNIDKSLKNNYNKFIKEYEIDKIYNSSIINKFDKYFNS